MTHVVLVQEPVREGKTQTTKHEYLDLVRTLCKEELSEGKQEGDSLAWLSPICFHPALTSPWFLFFPWNSHSSPMPLFLWRERDRERKAWLSPHSYSFCIHKTKSWLMNYNDRQCALLYINQCMPWAMSLRLLGCKINSAVINLLMQTILNLICYCSSNVCLTLYGVYFT